MVEAVKIVPVYPSRSSGVSGVGKYAIVRDIVLALNKVAQLKFNWVGVPRPKEIEGAKPNRSCSAISRPTRSSLCAIRLTRKAIVGVIGWLMSAVPRR